MGVVALKSDAGRRRAAVFLDRDGVLNAVDVLGGIPHPPRSEVELRVLDGVREACRLLRDSGRVLIAVTNQPDVARGSQRREVVDAINARLAAEVGLDAVYVCPHDDADRCSCRKPAPGMLLAASERYGLDLARSVMVGDRWRDVEAGRRAGCRTVYVRSSYGEQAADGADLEVAGLSDAVEWICSLEGPGTHPKGAKGG